MPKFSDYLKMPLNCPSHFQPLYFVVQGRPEESRKWLDNQHILCVKTLQVFAFLDWGWGGGGESTFFSFYFAWCRGVQVICGLLLICLSFCGVSHSDESRKRPLLRHDKILCNAHTLGKCWPPARSVGLLTTNSMAAPKKVGHFKEICTGSCWMQPYIFKTNILACSLKLGLLMGTVSSLPRC